MPARIEPNHAIERDDAYLDADETWRIVDAGGNAARCALWFHGPSRPNGERTGCIGGYSAHDADAAERILAHAFARLRENGCTVALGPLDGSTWRRYRLVTWSSGQPPFAREPVNPATYVDHFVRAGFEPVAHYTSWFDDNWAYVDPRSDETERTFRNAGVTVRSFATHAPERDLRAIYDLSLGAFASNDLQTPIGFDEFAAMYRPALALVDPAFVLIAERAGRPCGFVFALPDRTFARTGTVLIAKTLARDPDPAFRGLGALLAARVRRAAAHARLTGFVSALIHEDNASRAFPQAFGARVFRRYALFGKHLA